MMSRQPLWVHQAPEMKRYLVVLRLTKRKSDNERKSRGHASVCYFSSAAADYKRNLRKAPKKHDGRATVSNSGAVRTSAVVALFVRDGRDVGFVRSNAEPYADRVDFSRTFSKSDSFIFHVLVCLFVDV